MSKILSDNKKLKIASMLVMCGQESKTKYKYNYSDGSLSVTDINNDKNVKVFYSDITGVASCVSFGAIPVELMMLSMRIWYYINS